MPFDVTIKPGEHAFACEADETVLEAAMKADLLLPYGCRNGACGTCKGRILSGSVDYGPHAPSTLTDDEKRRGLALFCCARPRSSRSKSGADTGRGTGQKGKIFSVPARSA